MPAKQTKCLKSEFAVVVSRVFIRDDRVIEDWLDIRKINLVLAQIEFALRLVPGDHASDCRCGLTSMSRTQESGLPFLILFPAAMRRLTCDTDSPASVARRVMVNCPPR